MNSMIRASGRSPFPADLSILPTDQLLNLSNRCFRDLDCEHPVQDALFQYYALAAELEVREAATKDTGKQALDA